MPTGVYDAARLPPEPLPCRCELDDETLDDDFDGEDADTPDEEGLEDDELDEELDVEEDLAEGEEIVEAAPAEGGDEDEEEDVPTARRKRPSDVDEDEDEDVDPDDVEADLDAILKDRIAASSDDDEEDEEQVDTGPDADGTERVAAKTAEEFTCDTCFLIVHPRQFGRKGHLVCPEGYSPCSSIAVVEKRLKRAAKK